LLLGAAVALTLAAPAGAQPPVPGAPAVIDASSSAIVRPAALGMSIARGGTGGLVYLKTVAGANHVFVSRLVAGSFGTPVQVDTGLTGNSSQPVIAAGRNGLLLIGFINSGELYVVDGNQAGQFTAPLGLAGGAINPAISITDFGKAYLAFAVADGSGHDVRAAYYYNGDWALESPPLNATAGDDAGTGTDRPAVAAAGDGIAIVAWGENGHIYLRRVWGTAASVAIEQADAAPAGCTESSADEPVVGAGGDSSYAAVAFREDVSCGGQQMDRVLMNRLQGSQYDGITAVDGLSATSNDGATDPQIAVGEYGTGWVTAARIDSDDVFAAGLAANDVFTGTIDQVNSLTSEASPFQVPAMAGYHADFIAWQQEPGVTPGGEIRLRWAGDGVTLGPELVLSSPAQGPTDAADGLAAAGDISGDVAVAWLQGASGSVKLIVDQLYEPPGGFSPTKTFAYATTAQPVLTWTRPSGWGPMTYALTVDGTLVSQTNSTSSLIPAPLSNGPHSWRVMVTNPAGQQTPSALATVFVDTIPPTATLKLPKRSAVGFTVRAVVRYADHPPAGQPRADASGVATVLVRWGDGKTTRVSFGRHTLTHVYKRVGRYQITLVVTDKAGNRTRVIKFLKIVKRKPTHTTSTRGGK
jgi:hypothetical protein